jgi:hypothetical protein
MTHGRFPPPWRVVEMTACFVVQDATGRNVASFHFQNDAGEAPAAAALLKEAAGRGL